MYLQPHHLYVQLNKVRPISKPSLIELTASSSGGDVHPGVWLVREHCFSHSVSQTHTHTGAPLCTESVLGHFPQLLFYLNSLKGEICFDIVKLSFLLVRVLMRRMTAVFRGVPQWLTAGSGLTTRSGLTASQERANSRERANGREEANSRERANSREWANGRERANKIGRAHV